MTDTTAIEQREADLPDQREEAVVAALLTGRTVQSVRKQFGLSTDEIDQIIARAWPVDSRSRIRMIMTDLGLLDRLITEFYRRSLISRDATSAAFATVALKALERKHNLVGMDSPTRIDVVQLQTAERPSSYAQLRAAVMSLKHNGQQPDGNGSDDPADPAAGDGGER